MIFSQVYSEKPCENFYDYYDNQEVDSYFCTHDIFADISTVQDIFGPKVKECCTLKHHYVYKDSCKSASVSTRLQIKYLITWSKKIFFYPGSLYFRFLQTTLRSVPPTKRNMKSLNWKMMGGVLQIASCIEKNTIRHLGLTISLETWLLMISIFRLIKKLQLLFIRPANWLARPHNSFLMMRRSLYPPFFSFVSFSIMFF